MNNSIGKSKKPKVRLETLEPETRTQTNDPAMDMAFRMIPMSLANIERLITRLNTCLDDYPDTEYIHEFLKREGLAPSTFYDMCNKHANLKEAHRSFMQKIGWRNYHEARKNRGHWGATQFMLHIYDPLFMEAKQLEAQLRKQAEPSVEHVVVVNPIKKTKKK